MYAAQCATCHGPNGNNIGTVNLAQGRFRLATSDDDLKRLIQTGIPGAGMPPISLESGDLTALVAFIRSGLDVNARAVPVAVGDAARGRAIFEGKGTCLTCHRVSGQGSAAAPDLTDIGSVRTPSALQLTLMDPSGAMLPLNRPIRAVTSDGTTIRGRRLNEDTYTVQLIDERERLHHALESRPSPVRNHHGVSDAVVPRHADERRDGRSAGVSHFLEGMTMARRILAAVAVLVWTIAWIPAHAQVTYERLLGAAKEAHNWLTYSGGYSSNRHSPLDQITPANVKNLEQKWVLQGNVVGTWQATPLVIDGVMYVTQRLNDVVALDAQSGRPYWMYRHNPPADQRACCGSNNRGVAVLGDLVYMGTLDAHLVAIDAKTGKKRWEVEVGDYNVSYSITLAPLAVKDKIIVGVGGAELGIRGFIAAYDAKTGTQAWKNIYDSRSRRARP